MFSVHRRTRRIVTGALSAAAALTLTTVATAASAQPAAPVGRQTAAILGESAPGAIKDSYIVVFRDTAVPAGRVAASAGDLAERFGGRVARSYTRTVRGFSVRMPAAAARVLAAHPSVAYVEQDRVVSMDTTQTNPPWGVDRVDQRALPLSKSYGYAGSTADVTAYILDTGIRTTHADFGGRASSGPDFIDNDAVSQDCNGHGTHVAGTVGGARYGVAKEVKLVGIRVLNCEGSGRYSQIIAGVDWVTANAVKPAVANMSLGGTTSTALDDAVRRSIASGVTYAVAAGNDNVDACTKSPARTPQAITVGATDSADARASFSNYGSCVDIFAPGVRIVSAGTSGDTVAATMNGTSMAAPHVAGAAAVVLAATPSATPAQVRDALVGGGTAGVVAGAGSGSPNRLLYTGVGVAPAAPAPTASPMPTAAPTATAAPKPTVTPTTAPTATPTAAPSVTPTTAPSVTPTAAPTVTPTTAPVCQGTQATDLTIADMRTVTSSIALSGCAAGAASRTTKVEVHIRHPHRGSLQIDLVAPNGAVLRLKGFSATDSADDIHVTYTVNASSSSRNGTWKLRIWDMVGGGVGHLDSWTVRP
jgi:subtilisin family serine protease